MRKVKVALIQRCSAGSKEHNLAEITALAREAAAKCPDLDLIVFPEYNNFMPPSPQESYQYSETMDGLYITTMKALAKELHCYIDVGSFCERAGDKVKNTVVVIVVAVAVCVMVTVLDVVFGSVRDLIARLVS